MSDERVSIYVWQEQEPNGRWGTIASGAMSALLGVSGLSPLIARSKESAETMKRMARAHGRVAKRRVRLARYDFAEVEEELSW